MSSIASTSSFASKSSDDAVDDGSYRSVSLAAILGAILGVVGLLSLLWPALIVVPLAGVVTSVAAVMNLHRFPAELTGRPLAFVALVLNVGLLIGAPAYHGYVYATEVPEGSQRIAFGDLKSPTGAPDVPTEAALKLDGKQVFVKGYIHPTSISAANSKNFVLVPDFATCCFGGQPPLTHMIEVTLTGDLNATATKGKVGLAGILRVDPQLKPISGLQGVYYQLRADHFK